MDYIKVFQFRWWMVKLYVCIFALFLTESAIAYTHTASFKVENVWYTRMDDGQSVAVDFTGTLSIAGRTHDCYSGDVVIPSTVEYDGKSYNVTGILERAFYYCRVTSITLPPTIQSIGFEAFRGCTITELQLPSSLVFLGNSVFAECSVEKLTIPNGVEALPDYAFRGAKISEIKIPSTVKSIGQECFYESRLTKLTVPEGVEEIKDGTFYNTPLEEIILPATLKKIGNKAFQKTKLNNLLLQHSSVESIGREAFRESSLTQITLPATVKTLGELAFRDCVDLAYVNISCPLLEAIEKQTFYGCSALEQLSTIPDAVQCIGEEAFCNCTSPLLTVKFNASSQLKNIGVRAFNNTGIYALEVPASTQDIGEHAFANCSMLDKVTFAANSQMESIGYSAFQNSSLKEILLPNSIKTIGHDAFAYCASLTKVSIPQNLATIELQTFIGCTSLQDVLFTEPSQLKSIKDRAFNKCVGLERITLPEGLEEIGADAFRMEYNYSNEGLLSYVYIPSTVKSIGTYAFSKYDNHDITIDLASPIESVGLYAFQAAEIINIWHYDSWIRLVCNSELGFTGLGGYGRFFPHVYREGKLVTDYVIPDDITSIRNQAFQNNTDMLSVIFPNALTAIGELAFSGCTSLQSVTFGESFQSMGPGAFNKCSLAETHIKDYDSWIKLILNGTTNAYEYTSTFYWNWFPNVYLNGDPVTEYVIPDEYPTIRKSCFANNKQITSIILPNSLNTIEEDAFTGCTVLQNVTFMSPPEEIGANAFKGCTLTTVDIGNLGKWCSVKFLGSYNTSGTYKNKITSNPLCMMSSPKVIVKGRQLENLNIPSTVKAISPYAFLSCQRFDQVTIPNALTEIGGLAFGYCSDLTTLKFGKNPSLTTIGGSAFCHTALYEVQLPNSVKTIGDYAFDSCTGLKKIVMPQGLQLIDRYAFSNCTALEDALLPEGLQTIGHYAFNACSSLKSVHIPTTLQTIGMYAYSKTGITDVYITDLTSWCNIEKGNGSLVVTHLYLNSNLITDLIIPNDVTSIQPYSFYQNLDLVSVTVPEGVTSIGKSCFSGCHNLVSVRLPKSIENLESAAFNSSPKTQELRNYDINLSVADLGSYVKANKGAGFVFERKNGHGTNLYLNDILVKDVTIPEGITALSRYVFRKFNIQSATLPSTLENIDKEAFALTPQLKYLYSKSRFAPTCTANGLVLSNVKAIYVPKGCAEKYKGKWSTNADIIKEAPDEMLLEGEQSAESILEVKMAYSAVNNVPLTYVDLTEATLDETVTSETLKEGDNSATTLYFLPSGINNIIGDNIVQDDHAENVVLENGSDIAIPMTFTADVVNLSCAFPESGTEAYTLCLPYSLTTLPEGMKAYTIKETNSNGDLVFAPVESIEANMPYLITVSNQVNNLNAQNVTIEETPDEMEDAGNDDFEFRGTLCDISNEDAVDMGAYILTANREWQPISSDTPDIYIKAGTAYLVPVTSANAKVLSLLTTEQGEIEYMQADTNGDGKISITDAVAIVSHILGEDIDGFIADVADVNEDGNITITDAVAIVDMILNGTALANERADVEENTLDPQ